MFLQCLLTRGPLLFTRTLVNEWWPPEQCVNLAVESLASPRSPSGGPLNNVTTMPLAESPVAGDDCICIVTGDGAGVQ